MIKVFKWYSRAGFTYGIKGHQHRLSGTWLEESAQKHEIKKGERKRKEGEKHRADSTLVGIIEQGAEIGY